MVSGSAAHSSPLTLQSYEKIFKLPNFYAIILYIFLIFFVWVFAGENGVKMGL